MKCFSCIVILIALCVAPLYSHETESRALLIIDVQHCFTKGGSLEVPDGDAVVPVINTIRNDYGSLFDLVVETQDWHCPDHVSFASQYNGLNPFTVVELTYNSNAELCASAVSTQNYTVNCTDFEYKLNQTLWPDHCVMNTASADFHPQLQRDASDTVVRKGYHCDVDSYSGFYDNGGFSHTELNDVLKNKGISSVFITGLALDFCVYYTAVDAQKLGYQTYVVLDATRGIAQDSVDAAESDMTSKGIKLINSGDLMDFIASSATIPLPLYSLASISLLLFLLLNF